jgi:hypothetical protein
MKKTTCLALALIVVLSLSGCGKSTSGKNEKYDLGQFKSLMKIRADIEAFSRDMMGAAAAVKPTEECLSRIRKVIAGHKAKLPPVARSHSGLGSPDSPEFRFTPSIKGTETGTLLHLYKHGVSPAGVYLRALMYLYGVEDFVSFVKQHLVDYMPPDGNFAETINPDDPPPQKADGNWYYDWPPVEKVDGGPIVQEFGMPSPPSGMSIKMVREVTGVLTYYLTSETYTPYNMPKQCNLWMAENSFGMATNSTITSGDEMLLDNLSM